MARIRYIKPGLATNEDLFDAEHRTGIPMRLGFALLSTHCDRAGRFEWKPRRVKLALFPYDHDPDLGQKFLDELVRLGMCERYEVDGQTFGRIPPDAWSAHQRPHRDEPASKIPEPAAEDSSTDSPPLRHRVDSTHGGVESTHRSARGMGNGEWELEHTHTASPSTREGGPDGERAAARAWPASPSRDQNGDASPAAATAAPCDDHPVVRPEVATAPRSPASGAGNAKSPSMPPHGPPGRIARATDADLRPWFEAACRGLGQSLTWGPRYVMSTERIVVHAEKHALTVDQVEAVARHYRVRCKDGTPSFPKFADDIDRWRADWQASRSGGKAPPKTPAQLRAKGVCPEHPGEKLTPAGRCDLCDEVALLRKRLGDGSTEAVA